MGRVLAEPVTKGGIKSLAAIRPGTALDLGHIFFIYKKKNQPGSGHQLLIEARARANQQGGQGGVLLRENSHEAKARANQGARNDIRHNFDEGSRTDEALADMAGRVAFCFVIILTKQPALTKP